MKHIGIDLGLRGAHRAVVCEDGRVLGKAFPIGTGQAGIDKLERRARRENGEPFEVVMEPTGLVWLPLAAELVRRGHRVYVPKTAKLAALRSFYSQHTKSDSTDAHAQSMVRHVDPDGTYELDVSSADQIMLRMFVKQRARLTSDIGRSKTRIQSWLLLASPALANLLAGRKTFIAPARKLFAERLDPFAVQAEGVDAFLAWWRALSHQNGGAELAEKVWAAIEETCDSFGPLRESDALPFDYDLLQQLIASELRRVDQLEEHVRQLEVQIDALFARQDAHAPLREVPGFGAATAPVMAAFIGNISRFPKLKSFTSWFGFIPRTKQTGGRPGKRQRMTKAGPKLAKQYIYLAAEVARRHDPELAWTYRQARTAGRHHVDAMCIVAHKLLRKVYGFLKRRQVDDSVSWRRVNPFTGKQLSSQEARAWIAEYCPSKAEEKRRPRETAKVTGPGAPDSGSSAKDATTTPPSTPSHSRVTASQSSGQPVDELVDRLVKAFRLGGGDSGDFDLDRA